MPFCIARFAGRCLSLALLGWSSLSFGQGGEYVPAAAVDQLAQLRQNEALLSFSGYRGVARIQSSSLAGLSAYRINSADGFFQHKKLCVTGFGERRGWEHYAVSSYGCGLGMRLSSSLSLSAGAGLSHSSYAEGTGTPRILHWVSAGIHPSPALYAGLSVREPMAEGDAASAHAYLQWQAARQLRFHSWLEAGMSLSPSMIAGAEYAFPGRLSLLAASSGSPRLPLLLQLGYSHGQARLTAAGRWHQHLGVWYTAALAWCWGDFVDNEER